MTNPDRIEVHYQDLADAATRFDARFARLDELHSRLKTRAVDLVGEGWQGEGADAFLQEMETHVLPRMKRLSESMESAATTTRQIAEIIQDAENQAGALFHGAGAALGAAGAKAAIGAGGSNNRLNLKGKFWGGFEQGIGKNESVFKFGPSLEVEYELFKIANQQATVNGVDMESTLFKSEVEGEFKPFEWDPKNGTGSMKFGGGVEITAFETKLSTEVAGIDLGYESKLVGEANLTVFDGELDLKNGEFVAKTDLSLFAGAEIEGSAGYEGDYGKVVVEPGLTAGWGYKWEGSITMDNWKIRFNDIEVGASVGVGATFGMDAEIDLNKAGGAAVEWGKKALDFIF